MLIEVIASTLDEALELERLGVDRIELVTAVSEGGLTPSHAMINQVCEQVRIPVNVMLKTRGDYQFSDNDMKIMLEDLSYIRASKANGIVFGALKGDALNLTYIQQVIANKGHLQMTLNRSFDRTADLEEALLAVETLPIDRMLTSGHEQSVITGASTYRMIQQRMAGKMIVMAGAGLNLKNVDAFVKENHPAEIHFGSGTHIDGKWGNPISEAALKQLVKLK